VFAASGQTTAATVAMLAALLHTLNHAAFKGLLFLAAGSVAHATGTRNMNRLGGLIRRQGWTAAAFLIGAVAIAGLPPLNGFVSEWLLLQSLLPGLRSPDPLVASLSTLVVGMVALTGGLAAAAFVKAFGITFLAMPRTREAADAHEASVSMRVAMGWLAAWCVALGLGAAPVLATLGRITSRLWPAAPAFEPAWTIATPDGFARMSPPLLALILGLGALGTAAAIRLTRPKPVRLGPTWGCGRLVQTPRMEYTSTSFAEPLRRVFAALYRPTEDLSIDFHPTSKYFVQSIEYRSRLTPWFDRYLYGPVIAAARGLGRPVRALQSGSVHAYLAYVFFALLALLALLLLPGGTT
jgi:NADH:ubiquinone oxidoreductase subunit 5 (subunit L)/multisubunit Na+/H+ antiporter MnhA subunit